MPSEVGLVFKDESKNGFMVERTVLDSLPQIRVIVLPLVIFPPSGYCPLLSVGIVVSLDNP